MRIVLLPISFLILITRAFSSFSFVSLARALLFHWSFHWFFSHVFLFSLISALTCSDLYSVLPSAGFEVFFSPFWRFLRWAGLGFEKIAGCHGDSGHRQAQGDGGSRQDTPWEERRSGWIQEVSGNWDDKSLITKGQGPITDNPKCLAGWLHASFIKLGTPPRPVVSALGGGNQQLCFSQVKLEMPVGASVGGGVQVRGLVKSLEYREDSRARGILHFMDSMTSLAGRSTLSYNP